MRSKEERLLELFFENPTREWHFEELLKDAKIARSKAAGWLKRFVREGIVKRVKEKGKMPYYFGACESVAYRNRKKLFAMSRLYDSGLLNHLGSLPKAKSVILFGSFTRSDWYRDSDIDVFIYGDPEGLRIADYELKLHKDLQMFICRTREDLARLGAGFIRNVLKGNLIKGNLDFIGVDVNA